MVTRWILAGSTGRSRNVLVMEPCCSALQAGWGHGSILTAGTTRDTPERATNGPETQGEEPTPWPRVLLATPAYSRGNFGPCALDWPQLQPWGPFGATDFCFTSNQDITSGRNGDRSSSPLRGPRWRCRDSQATCHLLGLITWASADCFVISVKCYAVFSFGASTCNLKRERESDRDREYIQQGKYLLYKINIQLSKM